MIKNIFAGKSSRILRVLLLNPSVTWTTRELSSEANVSLGLASLVTNKLIDMGFLIRDRSIRLRLRNGEELLRRWAAVYNFRDWPARLYYAEGTVYQIGKKLAWTAEKTGLKYAFTGPFATDLLTRYIRPARIHMYITDVEAIKNIVDALELSIAEIGGNIIFVISDDEAIFYKTTRVIDERIGQVNIVSDVQLFLDLHNYTDRAREAAERLLSREYLKKAEYDRLVKSISEQLMKEGLVSVKPEQIGYNKDQPDIVLFDPKTKTYLLVECKSSTAKLSSVNQLKEYILDFNRGKVRGILFAPNITQAAEKELRKAGLEFRPIKVLGHGIHERTG